MENVNQHKLYFSNVPRICLWNFLTANEKCVTSGMEDYKRAQFLNEHAAGLETNMGWTSLGCNTDCHEPVISSQRLELSKTISEP